MKWAVVIGLLVSMATGQATRNSSDWLRYEDEWGRYKTKFSKVYLTQEEESWRGKIFRENLDFISKHNREADRGLHSYRLGVTPFADRTQEELAQPRAELARILYSQNSSDDDLTPRANSSGEGAPVPREIDWRKDSVVTEVRNQGDCNACYAMAAAEVIEAQVKLSGKGLVQRSAQQFVDCTWRYGDRGCLGGTVRNCFYYAQKASVMTENEYPFVGEHSSRDRKCKYKDDTSVRVGDIIKVKKGNEEDLRRAVAKGPVAACIHGSDTKFYFYVSGIYNSCSPKHNGRYLDHALLVIGFNSNTKKDYWLVKNSWGTDWGEKGYARIAMNEKDMCGIADRATYAKVVID